MSGTGLPALRDRLLTSARFRSLAQKLPIFQSVARRQAYDLFRLASGFIHSQVLLACVRIDLFERLRDGPLTITEVAMQSGLEAERAAALLRAGAALGLLERRGEEAFGLGMLGASMVENESVLALVRHHALLYEDLADPVSLFDGSRTETQLSKLWPYALEDAPGGLETDAVDAYTALMATSQEMVAEQVLAAFSLRRFGSLLDLGGGAGAFLTAVARRWPHLELTLLDLPAVTEIAATQLAKNGLAERVKVVGIDATAEPIPGCHDVVSLVRIIHDHSDERALQLLRTAREALNQDGVLLVAEPLAGRRGAGPLIDAYFNVYLLAMGSGRPRTFGELEELLREAGFRQVRRRRTRVPLITSVVVAQR